MRAALISGRRLLEMRDFPYPEALFAAQAW